MKTGDRSKGSKNHRAQWRLGASTFAALTLALAFGTGCFLFQPPNQNRDLDSRGGKPSTTFVKTSNGFGLNGLGINGMGLNGFGLNGLGLNGIGYNGLGLNGLGLNGMGLNGFGLNGIGYNGMGLNGFGLNGMGLNGMGLNGLGLNGIGYNGIGYNGMGLNGMGLNGFGLNGFGLNGFGLNGLGLNGFGLNGFGLNGFGLNAFGLNGLGLNGMGLNGFGLNGLGLNGAGAHNAFQYITFLAECALADGQCITVYPEYDANADCQPSQGGPGCQPELTICGTGTAIDAGWADGAPDLTKHLEMAQCVAAKCEEYDDAALAAGYTSEEGQACSVSYAPEIGPAIYELLKYMTSCALPSCSADPNNCRVTVSEVDLNGDGTVDDLNGDGNTNDWVFEGALGLTPSWSTQALDQNGEELISACLLARTNAYRQTVLISLRRPSDEITTVERRRFSHMEGAYFGNLFNNPAQMYTCSGQGDGLAGRMCAGGDETCGFESIGSCMDGNTGVQGIAANGAVTSVVHGGNTYNNVITVFNNRSDLVGAGQTHTCVRTRGGGAVCVGTNDRGQTAGSSFSPTSTLGYVQAGNPADDFNLGITASLTHSCARTAAGALHCWGNNDFDQLGRNAPAGNVNTPTEVPEFRPGTLEKRSATRVALGYGTTGVIHADGTASRIGLTTAPDGWIAGVNDNSMDFWCDADQQAASGMQTTSTPASLGIGEHVLALESASHHACAIAIPAEAFSDPNYDHNGGTLYCWGANNSGQVGIGTGTVYYANPQRVTDGVIDVSLGSQHTCYIDVNHDLHCVGSNTRGQLGVDIGWNLARRSNNCGYRWPIAAKGARGYWSRQATAQQVPGKWTDVVAGTHHTCALRADKKVFCWGADHVGQTGTAGDNSGPYPQEVSFPGSSPVDALIPTGGAIHSCARMRDGAVYCWGDNWDGQLGIGPDSYQNTAEVPGLLDTAAFGYPTTIVGCDGDGVCRPENDETAETCPSECGAVCGDRFVSAGETAASCPVDFCGNGVVDSGEACDDGNDIDGDGCSQFCTAEGGGDTGGGDTGGGSCMEDSACNADSVGLCCAGGGTCTKEGKGKGATYSCI